MAKLKTRKPTRKPTENLQDQGAQLKKQQKEKLKLSGRKKGALKKVYQSLSPDEILKRRRALRNSQAIGAIEIRGEGRDCSKKKRKRDTKRTK